MTTIYSLEDLKGYDRQSFILTQSQSQSHSQSTQSKAKAPTTSTFHLSSAQSAQSTQSGHSVTHSLQTIPINNNNNVNNVNNVNHVNNNNKIRAGITEMIVPHSNGHNLSKSSINHNHYSFNNSNVNSGLNKLNNQNTGYSSHNRSGHITHTQGTPLTHTVTHGTNTTLGGVNHVHHTNQMSGMNVMTRVNGINQNNNNNVINKNDMDSSLMLREDTKHSNNSILSNDVFISRFLTEHRSATEELLDIRQKSENLDKKIHDTDIIKTKELNKKMIELDNKLNRIKVLINQNNVSNVHNINNIHSNGFEPINDYSNIHKQQNQSLTDIGSTTDQEDCKDSDILITNNKLHGNTNNTINNNNNEFGSYLLSFDRMTNELLINDKMLDYELKLTKTRVCMNNENNDLENKFQELHNKNINITNELSLIRNNNNKLILKINEIENNTRYSQVSISQHNMVVKQYYSSQELLKREVHELSNHVFNNQTLILRVLLVYFQYVPNQTALVASLGSHSLQTSINNINNLNINNNGTISGTINNTAVANIPGIAQLLHSPNAAQTLTRLHNMKLPVILSNKLGRDIKDILNKQPINNIKDDIKENGNNDKDNNNNKHQQNTNNINNNNSPTRIKPKFASLATRQMRTTVKRLINQNQRYKSEIERLRGLLDEAVKSRKQIAS